MFDNGIGEIGMGTYLAVSPYYRGDLDRGSDVVLDYLTSNPLFLDQTSPGIGGGDYRIHEDSPAKDTGNNEYNIKKYDLAGKTRIVDTIDYGAYEWTPPATITITGKTGADLDIMNTITILKYD